MIMSNTIQKHGDSPDVEARLARLERSSKAWRLAALGLAGAWALNLSCSRSDSGGPRVAAADQSAENGDGIVRKLRVNEIELVNLKGEAVGWINKGGEPSFTMRSGKCQASLGVLSLEMSNEYAMSRMGPGFFGVTSYEGVAGRQYLELQSALRGDRAPTDEKWKELTEAGERAEAVSVVAHDDGGGMVTVRNTFGKPVVEAQANKANEGAVYVNDVNGKIGDALAPRMPR
jgi:hypothetical protein